MAVKIFEQTATADIGVRVTEIYVVNGGNKGCFTMGERHVGTAEQSIALMTSIERVGFTMSHYEWML